MALSTSGIFHFTNKISAIEGILTEGFRVKYCAEHIETKSGTIEAAFPMVSFCDIPLSQVKEHIDKYGCYGIGMHNDWAQMHGLNPVMYIAPNSTVGGNYYKFISHELSNPSSSNPINIQNALADSLRYLKNERGTLLRSGHLPVPDYKFIDEREWRYVPDETQAPMYVPMDLYRDPTYKANINASIAHLRLHVSKIEINYIILKEEDEINDFVTAMRKTAWKDKNDYALNHLISRIITVERIMNDF